MSSSATRECPSSLSPNVVLELIRSTFSGVMVPPLDSFTAQGYDLRAFKLFFASRGVANL